MRVELDSQSESGTKIAFMEERKTGDAEKYLGDLFGEADFHITTVDGSGWPGGEGRENLADALSILEKGSTVYVAGELNGLCYSQVEDMLAEIPELNDGWHSLEHGKRFPETGIEQDVDGKVYPAIR
ncbi:MAG: hypothetical protein ABEJ99_00850 [Candidatus Nanohaloarchaea archaeon]